ncbi:type IV toxin-antitoxin system AbiEi family antitoxin [Mycobacterium malmoense]|uniref:type IV toxin-antitoxin system AbiEi family antitoxin n=1 Tax=Mycobacterium malmoense TaxID=1780 RepID=UPI0008F8D15D|nr:type IV toxin-antitoxin system AbiEi family antitoxin [Mycobacterium malmoense]OIN81314.1 hypothetical protein BMG05_08435 [Mycobacterium malmoense]
MNIPKILNIKGPLERDVVSILRDIPGVTIEATVDGGARADVVVRAGDVSHMVEVKARSSINVADARRLIDDARHLPRETYLLVVARNTTEEARRQLEDAGVAIIDAQGNMRVDMPGMFLWSEGRSTSGREKRGEPPIKLTGKAGVAAQALLREPQRWWQVHDLATAADISVGQAHRVLTRLEREHLIDVEGTGPKRIRRVSNPTALLDLWAEEMRDRRVSWVRAFRLARDTRTYARSLSDLLTRAKIDHAVTGPAGAARLAPFITSFQVVDIWITERVALADATNAIGAEVVHEGHNILLRQAAGDIPLVFRSPVEKVWTVNPFRLYFDLRQDPRRGREQAERLREEVIGF